MLKLAVTTKKRPSIKLEERSRMISERLRIPMIQRQNMNIKPLMETLKVDGIIVVTEDSNVLRFEDFTYEWHPNTTDIKFRQLKKGSIPLEKALNVSVGDTVIDGTLGFASDAIIAKVLVGRTGKVIGLEANPVLALLTELGIKHYTKFDCELQQAARDIEVVNAVSYDYLRSLESNSVDIVYFDPMFETTGERSSGMHKLKQVAYQGGIDRKTIEEAVRVSRKRVVIKERYACELFSQLAIHHYVGKEKEGRVVYGIIDKNEDC